MEQPLLNDPAVYPSDELLEKMLGKAYPAFREFTGMLTAPDSGIEPEWNYYRDGHAWLRKHVYKKKNLCWLSVWDGYVSVAFYFTEKTAPKIEELDIPEEIKNGFRSNAPVGKLLPLVIHLQEPEQVPVLMKIVECKKTLK